MDGRRGMGRSDCGFGGESHFDHPLAYLQPQRACDIGESFTYFAMSLGGCSEFLEREVVE